MTWRVAKAIKTLQGEVNKQYPDRPRGADGTIGDARHQAEKSDHNPVSPHAGVVTAWDITTASFTTDLAETLRLMGKAGDERVKYVIYRGRICSSRDNWAWRAYTGYSQHFDHIHLSVSDDPAFYDSTAPWNVFDRHAAHAQHQTTPPEDELTADDLSKIQAMIDAAVAKLHADLVVILHGDDKGHVNSIDSIAKQVGVPQK